MRFGIRIRSTLSIVLLLQGPSIVWSQTLDEYILNQMSLHHIPGLSACIVKKGALLWVGNYGLANISGGIQVDSNTIFMLASVSKTVTATALMQLYEKGLFQLDDDIDNYLPFKVRNPSYPGTPITFKMLLSHTSSISDNSAILDTMYSFGMDHPMPLDTFLVNYLTPGGRLYDPEMSFSNFEPGSQWEYSNYAIALCGYLVEAITSIPFDAYCNVNIFQPLEMANTAWFMRDLDTTLIARPYQYYNGQYIDYGLYGYPDYPDGQLRTTVASLGNFLLANIDNGAFHEKNILDSSTVALMRTAQFPMLDPTQGIVWYRINAGRGRRLWGHNGGDLGVSTEMFLFEEDSSGVIVLTNGEAPVVEIRDRLFDVADTITTGVVAGSTNDLPGTVELYQNYPNPFNPITYIGFRIPQAGLVSLRIYDLLGREVATLIHEQKGQGRYVIQWDTSLPASNPNTHGAPVASGVYFYRLQVGSFSETKKLILAK